MGPLRLARHEGVVAAPSEAVHLLVREVDAVVDDEDAGHGGHLTLALEPR
jgi:hypothetical protein